MRLRDKKLATALQDKATGWRSDTAALEVSRSVVHHRLLGRFYGQSCRSPLARFFMNSSIATPRPNRYRLKALFLSRDSGSIVGVRAVAASGDLTASNGV